MFSIVVTKFAKLMTKCMVYKKIDEKLENACIKNVSGHCPFYEVLWSTEYKYKYLEFFVFNDSIQKLSILK